MVWSLLVLGVVGIVLGYSFRAPTLIVATFVTIVACLIYEAFADGFGWGTLVFALCMTLVLQGAYLLGVVAKVLRRGGRSRDA